MELREAGLGSAGLEALACLGVWLQLLFFSQYNLPHIWVAPGLLLAALADGSDNRETLP